MGVPPPSVVGIQWVRICALSRNLENHATSGKSQPARLSPAFCRTRIHQACEMLPADPCDQPTRSSRRWLTRSPDPRNLRCPLSGPRWPGRSLRNSTSCGPVSGSPPVGPTALLDAVRTLSCLDLEGQLVFVPLSVVCTGPAGDWQKWNCPVGQIPRRRRKRRHPGGHNCSL